MTRTYTPDETRLMVAKMIGLLGSDQDGEVLGAARQIKKLLAAEKLTFGDLKNWITGYQARDPDAQVKEYAKYPKAQTETAPEPRNGIAGKAGAILARHSAKLNPAERRFVSNILARATAAGDDYKMSPKQFSWFNDIAKRCLSTHTDFRV